MDQTTYEVELPDGRTEFCETESQAIYLCIYKGIGSTAFKRDATGRHVILANRSVEQGAASDN